jgi:hypothetical protein
VHENQLPFHGTSYRNFINAIKSAATKEAYETSLRRYLTHIKKTGTDDLLVNTEPRYIESQIIDYIMSLRNNGVSYAAIQLLVAHLDEYKRIVRDAAYTTEQR